MERHGNGLGKDEESCVPLSGGGAENCSCILEWLLVLTCVNCTQWCSLTEKTPGFGIKSRPEHAQPGCLPQHLSLLCTSSKIKDPLCAIIPFPRQERRIIKTFLCVCISDCAVNVHKNCKSLLTECSSIRPKVGLNICSSFIITRLDIVSLIYASGLIYISTESCPTSSRHRIVTNLLLQ